MTNKKWCSIFDEDGWTIVKYLYDGSRVERKLFFDGSERLFKHAYRYISSNGMSKRELSEDMFFELIVLQAVIE